MMVKVGSMVRSRDGEPIDAGLNPIGRGMRAVEGPKAWSIMTVLAGSTGWQEVVDRPVRVRGLLG